MGADRTTLEKILKEFYLPGLRVDLNDLCFLLTQVLKGSEMVEGIEVVQAILLGRNEAVGARAEGGTLPTAQNQGIHNVRSMLKYNYGAIKVSGPLLATGRTDRGSFARPLDTEMKRIVADLRNDVNRQLYGDGTGALFDVTGANTAGSVPVTTLTATELRHIRPGMVVDVGPVSPGANKTAAGGATVTAVTPTAVTLNATPTATAASDFFYRTGARDNEITGLRKIVAASGALYGLNPATAGQEEWKSVVITSLGTSITEAAFIGTAQQVNVRTANDINLWVTSAGIHRDTAALLDDLRRFNAPLEMQGGYRALDMSYMSHGQQGGKTVGLVWDADCPVSTVFGLSTDKLQWQRASDWDFMDRDGAILSRDTSRTDAYTADLFLYADLVTDSRASHVKIGGVTEPTALTFA